MKGRRFLFLAILVSVVSWDVQAQAKLMNSGATATSNQPPVPITIAVIDSGTFADEKAGITRVVATMKQVNDKFAGVNSELKGLQERLRNMQADIEKKQKTESAATIAQLTEQAQRLQLDIKRKAEDAQGSYQKQMNTALEPLQADVGTALSAYAVAKGILIIIDVNRIPLIYAHDSVDITKDIIAEYNRTHPAAATTAPARP